MNPQRRDFVDSHGNICCIPDLKINYHTNIRPHFEYLTTAIKHENSMNDEPVCFKEAVLCPVNWLTVGFFVFQVIYPHHSKLSEKEVSHPVI